MHMFLPFRHRYLKRLAAQTPPGETILFFFPDYRKHNPHQQLLADAMPTGFRYLPGSIEDALFFQRCAGVHVQTGFHLHWPERILAPRRFKRFLTAIRRFRQNGGATLWSIHNLLPRYDADEAAFTLPLLAQHMDRLHLFTRSALAKVEEIYRVREHKCLIAMRGSYAESYANTIDRQEARHVLGLKPQEIALCFLGQLRPYKGLDALLHAFDSLYAKHTHLKLLLAGRCSLRDYPGMRGTLQRARLMPGVMLHPGFVPRNQVQHYLNAADMLVLPHGELTNSGTFILGLSFGCCMIAPRSGAIAELVHDGQEAILYDPQDPQGLQEALERAVALTPQQRAEIGRQALELGHSLRWETLAAALCETVRAAPQAANA